MEVINKSKLSLYINTLGKRYSKEIHSNLREKYDNEKLPDFILEVIDECTSSGFVDGANIAIDIINDVLKKRLKANIEKV